MWVEELRQPHQSIMRYNWNQETDFVEEGMNKRKLLAKALAGSKNISFNEMIVLVEAFGFRLSRVNGSHHIFVHPKVRQIVNLQEKNGKAKPYQIRQFLELVEEYDLELGEQE